MTQTMQAHRPSSLDAISVDGYSLGLSLAGSIDWDKASEVEKPVELDRSRPLERPKAAKVARSWLERATQSSLSTGSVEPDARASSKSPSSKVDRAPARARLPSWIGRAGARNPKQLRSAAAAIRSATLLLMNVVVVILICLKVKSW